METRGYHVLLASDGSEAWGLLQDGDVPTIAILDWVMPEVEGIELCRRVRRLSRRHYTYILLLTAKNEPQSIIEGLSSGADDYVCKPPDPGELEARLLVAQRIVSFQECLIDAQERLRESQEARLEAERKLARCDALTGLGNRRAFYERAEAERKRAARYDRPLSVAYIDFDNFKQVNDTSGHEAGDQLLVSVAGILEKNLRAEDFAARLGGDEFAVLLPETGHAAAAFAINKLHRLLTAAMKEKNSLVTFSIGLVTYERAPENTELMVQKADEMMYMVKRQGKNGIHHVRGGQAANVGQAP